MKPRWLDPVEKKKNAKTLQVSPERARYNTSLGSFSNAPAGASTLLSPDVIDKLTKSLADHSKNLSKTISKEHFFEVCGDSSANVSNVKLSRARYKFFLTQRYGNAIAEKLHHTLDFNAGPIEYG